MLSFLCDTINKRRYTPKAESMGLVRDRLKFSFRRSSSQSPPPPPFTTIKSTDPPPEFLCPISGALMADPVIIPSGETFERACIEACRELSISPNSLSLDLSSSSSSLLLIPNSALRSAILRWCDIAGVPHPIPLSSELARRLVSSTSSKLQTNCSTEFLNQNSSPITFSSPSSSSSDNTSSSSSTEIVAPKPETPETPLHADSFEEEIFAKLKHAQIQEQENALISLLEATRESSSRRVSLGTPRLLAQLRVLLLSRDRAVKSNTLAIIVNLSIEPENKIRVVRSGVVPAIVDALQSSSREHAAGALFSLAMEEQNRSAIGVLGAVPPLLHLFCNSKGDLRARLEAGMAIHYLGLAEMNMAKIGRIPGAVKSLMVVAKGEERELRRVAMRVMVGMAWNKEGKAAMLDGGAVEGVVGLLRKEEVEEEDREMVVRMLYGMSMAGLRFRGIARRAGVEELLQRVREGLEGDKREMVRVTIRVIRGEEGERERDLGRVLWAEEEEEGEEVAVEERSPVHRRRMNRESGPNSAGF
ncbi:U-box domain-containing protein 39-like [Phalaenopsis equestris]|uniref:U-box domain-containing protein 39-like n=1 Tax=Phalaenopsis equestris TaxID=78828 RepID=UPI0009E630CF|nr:U-box domain-containing protein 39-like [Phalaenopsis equestris]